VLWTIKNDNILSINLSSTDEAIDKNKVLSWRWFFVFYEVVLWLFGWGWGFVGGGTGLVSDGVMDPASPTSLIDFH